MLFVYPCVIVLNSCSGIQPVSYLIQYVESTRIRSKTFARTPTGQCVSRLDQYHQ